MMMPPFLKKASALALVPAVLCLSADVPLRADEFTAAQKKLVRSLCGSGRYFECIAETKRLMHYDRDGSMTCEYRFLIGASFYMGGQYRSALKWGGDGDCGKGDARAKTLLAMTFLRLGRHGEALDALRAAGGEIKDPAHRFRVLSLTIEAALRGDDRGAMKEAIGGAGLLMNGDRAFAGLRGVAERYLDGGEKSPALAVVMSAAVPGAGQVYAGMAFEGALSFLGVAAAGVGSWFAFRAGRRDLFYLGLFFGGLFYTGNLYGAYNAALRWNRDRGGNLIREMRAAGVPEYDPMRDLGGAGVMR